MKITTIGLDLAKNVFVRPESEAEAPGFLPLRWAQSHPSGSLTSSGGCAWTVRDHPRCASVMA